MPENELLRTSDAERDKVIAALSDHFALGRLTLDELNERVGQFSKLARELSWWLRSVISRLNP